MLDGRYDYVGRDLSDSVTGADHSDDDTRFSPRVGLVYEPLSGVSLYASYSTSFTLVANYTSIRGGDNLFDPETGEQYEIGMKLDISPRLIATLAGYQLTRENVLTSSPTDPGVSIAVGEQRSRGFELDLTYKIMQGWNVLAAYAYTDAEVTKDNTIAVGNRPSNVPRNNARLWSSYSVQSGVLAGLTVGAGAYYADERYGDANNSFKLPSPDYVLISADPTGEPPPPV